MNFIVKPIEEKNADERVRMHNSSISHIINKTVGDYTQGYRQEGEKIVVDDDGSIVLETPDADIPGNVNRKTIGNALKIPGAPSRYNFWESMGITNNFKAWGIGMVMGIIFGFIDNFGLFLGMEALEETLEKLYYAIMKMIHHRLSDYIL